MLDSIYAMVRMREQYQLRGEEAKASEELTLMVIGTFQELIESDRYTMDHRGDASLMRDAFVLLAKAAPTLTNDKIKKEISNWFEVNHMLVEHDER